MNPSGATLTTEFPLQAELGSKVLGDNATCNDVYTLVWFAKDNRRIWYLLSLSKRILCSFDVTSYHSPTQWRLSDRSTPAVEHRLLLVLKNNTIYATYKRLNEENEIVSIERLHVCSPQHLEKFLNCTLLDSHRAPTPHDEPQSSHSTPPSPASELEDESYSPISASCSNSFE